MVAAILYMFPFLLLCFSLLVGSTICFIVLFSTAKDEHLEDAGYRTLQGKLVSIWKMNVFGDFEMSALHNSSNAWLGSVLYIFYTSFFSIVMLNLLIAILSDSYEHVQEHAPAELSREKASLCIEVFQVLPQPMKMAVEQRTRWLYVMLPATQVDNLHTFDHGLEYGLPLLRKHMQTTSDKVDVVKSATKDVMDEQKAGMLALEQKVEGTQRGLEEKLEGQIGSLKEKIGGLEEKFGGLEEKIGGLEDKIKDNADNVEKKLGEVLTVLADLDSRPGRVKGKK